MVNQKTPVECHDDSHVETHPFLHVNKPHSTSLKARCHQLLHLNRDTLPSYTPGFFITRRNVGTKSSKTISKWEFNTNNFQFPGEFLFGCFSLQLHVVTKQHLLWWQFSAPEEPTDLEGFSHYELLRIWRFNMVPKCSMYGIFPYIYHKFMENVGKYSIHEGLYNVVGNYVLGLPWSNFCISGPLWVFVKVW